MYNFCVSEISSLYLDVSKDRLYTFAKDSKERRASQTVLHEVLKALLRILAPILAFTTEEVHKVLDPEGKSIHLEKWDWKEKDLAGWKSVELNKKWDTLLLVREEVLKSLEEKRAKEDIGSSLEAKAVLYTEKEEIKKLLQDSKDELPTLFITSQVEISDKPIENANKSSALSLHVAIESADGKKCVRCWNYSPSVGSDKEFNDICSRCKDVVASFKK